MRRLAIVLALIAIVGLSVSPAAATIVEFSSTNGDVVFNIGTMSMTIQLTNIGDVTAIGNTLTGVVFTFSATPPAETLTAGTAPNGTVTCTGSGNSKQDPVVCAKNNNGPFSVPINGALNAWTLSANLSTDTLQAGGGSFKPYGIVNDSILTDGADGLGNSTHNPYLLGPVTFTKTFATAAPVDLTVTDVTFNFGTSGATEHAGLVPEPTTILLSGTALILLGYGARKRLFRGRGLTAA